MKRKVKEDSLATGQRATTLVMTPATEKQAVKAALLAKQVTGDFWPYVEILGLVPYMGRDTARGARPAKDVIRSASDVWVREPEP